MSNDTSRTPDTHSTLCLTDGGLETWLIFHKGRELRDFASFELLRDAAGRELLASYYRDFMRLAAESGLGFVAETPTWRANPQWGAGLGWSVDGLDAVNREAVAFVEALRRASPRPDDVFVCGNVGPRGDGYVAGEAMSVAEAEAFHGFQMRSFSRAGVAMASAFTITNVSEAKGIVRAAGAVGLPCVVSFTLETDGRLPSGEGLREAVEALDAEPETRPLYVMVNCAHPDHFADVLEPGAAWTRRIRGIRANASRMSHAELDACETLDDGDPRELGELYGALGEALPELAVVGGCCGTDLRHVRAIRDALMRETVS